MSMRPFLTSKEVECILALTSAHSTLPYNPYTDSCIKIMSKLSGHSSNASTASPSQSAPYKGVQETDWEALNKELGIPVPSEPAPL